MSRFDWPALMQAGMRRLQLTPAQFWALTPAELGLMLGLDNAGGPLRRAKLDELIRAFPDEVRDDGGRD